MLEEKTIYYVRWRGEVTGPCSGQQIRQMLGKGQITRFHDISTDRLAWKQLQKMIGPNPVATVPITEASTKDRNALQAQVAPGNGEQARAPVSEATAAVNARNAGPFLPAPRIDYSFLPMAELFQPGLLRRPVARWLLIFCTLPLLILLAHQYLAWGFAQSAWLVESFFCFFWAVFFFHIMKPETALWKTGLAYAVFTAFVGIPTLLLWQQVPLIKSFYSGVGYQGFLPQLLGFVLGVGLFEELCKVMPFFVINPRRYGLRTPGDGLVLGIMSGLGFALTEGVGYSINYWQDNATISTTAVAKTLMNFHGGPELFTQQVDALTVKLSTVYGGIFLVQFVRLMIMPLLHAAWSGVVGYYVGYAWLRGQWGAMFLGLFMVAGLHGLYDLFSGTIYCVIIACVSVALLLSIMVHHHRAAASVAQESIY